MQPIDEVKLELQRIPWFRDLTINHLDKISQITQLRRIKAGEVLFHEGDREDRVYIVMEGRIALDMMVPPRGKVRFATVEKWEVFGWSSITPNVHQRTAGATAVVDSVVASVTSSQLRDLCEQDHELGYRVYRRLANIVASRLMSSRLQLLDIFAEPEEKNAK